MYLVEKTHDSYITNIEPVEMLYPAFCGRIDHVYVDYIDGDAIEAIKQWDFLKSEWVDLPVEVKFERRKKLLIMRKQEWGNLK